MHILVGFCHCWLNMGKITLGEERVYLACRSQFIMERSQGRNKNKGQGRIWSTALFHLAGSTPCFNTVLAHLPRDGTTHNSLFYQLVTKQMPYRYAWQEGFLTWHALLPGYIKWMVLIRPTAGSHMVHKHSIHWQLMILNAKLNRAYRQSLFLSPAYLRVQTTSDFSMWFISYS